jgi:hypothetical protein
MNAEDYFQKPPKSIFKYFGLERVGILKDLRIRFANPATFNDPFEACPRFDLWGEEVANAALKKLTALHAELGISPSQSTKFVDDYKRQGLKERVNFHTQNFQKECGERFRMLCFCESVQSPLMWGHYCDSQKGFALEFDTTHPFFRQRLAKVQYARERPRINDPFPGLSIPLTKNDEWSYENEWRIVQEAASTMPHYEILPVESIKAIYFGLRMSPLVRWEIQDALSAEDRAHIKKFEMALDSSAYKMTPIPVSNGSTPSNTWLGEGI